MDKNILSFIREDTKTVLVKFFPARYVNYEKVLPEQIEVELNDLKIYRYITTLDLEPGDLVLVYVGQLPTVCEVQKVEDTLCIEPDSDIAYKWIAGKIDLSYFEKLQDELVTRQGILDTAYRENAKKTFRNMFLAGLDAETQTKLMGLTKSKGE